MSSQSINDAALVRMKDLFLLAWLEKGNLSNPKRAGRMFVRDNPKSGWTAAQVQEGIDRLIENNLLVKKGGNVSPRLFTREEARQGDHPWATLEGSVAASVKDPSHMPILLHRIEAVVDGIGTTVVESDEGSTISTRRFGRTDVHHVSSGGRVSTSDMPQHYETRIIRKNGGEPSVHVPVEAVKTILRSVDRRMSADKDTERRMTRALERLVERRSTHSRDILLRLDKDAQETIRHVARRLAAAGTRIETQVERASSVRDFYDWLVEPKGEVERGRRRGAVEAVPDAIEILLRNSPAVDAGVDPFRIVADALSFEGVNAGSLKEAARYLETVDAEGLCDQRRSGRDWISLPWSYLVPMAYVAHVVPLDGFEDPQELLYVAKSLARMAKGAAIGESDNPHVVAFLRNTRPMDVPDALKVFARMELTIEGLHAAQPLDALEALLQDDGARKLLASPKAWDKVGKVIDMIGLLDGRVTWFEKDQIDVASEDGSTTLRTITLEAAFEAGFDPVGSLGRFPFQNVEYGSVPALLTEGGSSFLVFVAQPFRMFGARIVGYDLRNGNEIGLRQRHLDLVTALGRRHEWPRTRNDRLIGRIRDIATVALAPWIGTDFGKKVVHVADPYEGKDARSRHAAGFKAEWWR